MSYSGNGCIKLLFRQFVDYLNAIFVLGNGRISPRIVNGDIGIILLEGTIDVNNLCVAYIRTILLESET